MADQSLNGKRCLITGAASGIGRATAFAAAAEGAELFLTDVQEEALEETVTEVRRRGGIVAWSGIANLADHEAVVAIAEEIHAGHPSMDVVMNIAGISIWGAIEEMDHSHWQRLVDINLMGPISVMECFVPPMIEAGRGGHIVNVSSAAGLFGLPWHAAYSASKFGLRGVSEVLRFDLRRHDIGVSLVCPGAVKTPLVGTVEIVGVDRSDPRIAKLTGRFERHAASPEKVAGKILQGIRKKKFMVYTSRDIQFGHWMQRKFAWPYERVMQFMNNYLVRATGR